MGGSVVMVGGSVRRYKYRRGLLSNIFMAS